MTTHNLHLTKVKHKTRGSIAHVTVDNAAKLNCISRETAHGLAEILTGLSNDNELRAVVLTGAGDKAFIGGADLRELGSLDHDGARLFITTLHEACAAIRACPVPVIGRINGVCLGAGLEIAICCDMRVAVDGATFAMPEVHMGLPSVIEAALLPGLIGWGNTREMLLTGRTYPAAEARDIGLIERVVACDDLDAAVQAWLDWICAAAPEAIRSQKRLMARWETTSVTEGITAGIDSLAQAYDTGEPQQRIDAFFANKTRQSGAGP